MTLPTMIVIAPDVMTRKVGDETVILHLGDGSYYGLDVIGTRIWTLLAEGRPPVDVCEAIVAEYEVTRSRAEQDLEALLNELLARGLVKSAA
jgi:hypothetical protein